MATAPSPPPFDPADDKTTRFLVSCSVVVVIATLAVFCRLLARAVTKVGFAPDDWFIILALLDAWAIFVMNVFQARNGQGKHFATLTLPEIMHYSKYLYIYDILYIIGVLLVQLSFLFFYERVFTLQNRYFRIAIWSAAALSILVFLASFFASVFTCTPIAYNWDRSIPGGHCTDAKAFYIAILSINVINDLIIVILPVPMIWKIQIRRPEKIGLVIIFLLGGFVCIGNFIRLPYLTTVNPLDLTWTLREGVIWGTAEVCIGITSACLPCYRPFLRSVRRGFGKSPPTSQSRRSSTLRFWSREKSNQATDHSHSLVAVKPRDKYLTVDSQTDSHEATTNHQVAKEANAYQHSVAAPDLESAGPPPPRSNGAIGVRRDVVITSREMS